VDRLTLSGLRQRFGRVPRRTTVIYDWHSEEGREFLDAVSSIIDSGVDPAEVGEAIGMRDFSSRWKVLGRKR
jgi:hypothetical protein